MPPTRGTKRKSDCSPVPDGSQDWPSHGSETTVPTNVASPHKRRRVGISAAQKQALLENLQLEITERARKLRANYHVHAQTLRTRVEIRVNRIPLSLRKTRMEDLLRKHLTDRHKALAVVTGMSERPPPVPQKDPVGSRPLAPAFAKPARGLPLQAGQRVPISSSSAVSDKENGGDDANGPKKRLLADVAHDRVLSPTSSNTRLQTRDRGGLAPGKSMMARPTSASKPVGASAMLSHMVEKARSTRATALARQAGHAAADAQQSKTAGATAPKTRKGGPAAVPAAGRSGALRETRAASGASESSDGSTSTVVRKGATTRAAAPKQGAATGKRTVMSTIKKGMTGAGTTRKTGTGAASSTSGTSTGRVLRKRG
ncbi:hypothetical protein P8C59_003366 [Phyllachora maydis]|uniref:Borealin N-terminal domain-containing protein n=1 Tax=Phyllachora maydis TaxID=1825666 RepID=A0AAD9I1B5_9PEZI|nr:hypothetical protein P8C59_003366 [Phyllachora maydis]